MNLPFSAAVALSPDGEHLCTINPGGGLQYWHRSTPTRFVRDKHPLAPEHRIRAVSMCHDEGYSEDQDPVYALCLTEPQFQGEPLVLLYRLTKRGWQPQALPTELDGLLGSVGAVQSVTLNPQGLALQLLLENGTVLQVGTQGYHDAHGYPTTQFARVEAQFNAGIATAALALVTFPAAPEGAPALKFGGLQAATAGAGKLVLYSYDAWQRQWQPVSAASLLPVPVADLAPAFSPDGRHLFAVRAEAVGGGVQQLSRQGDGNSFTPVGLPFGTDLGNVIGAASCLYRDELQVVVATPKGHALFAAVDGQGWQQVQSL